jgi:hypothetical protein
MIDNGKRHTKITSVEECKVCLGRYFNFYDRQW